MIKRGKLCLGASLNNMTTDRLSITIDGMQIYGACTDKMDPVTSYVDVSNLEKVTVYSGQEGAENTNTIGGELT
ncbi:TonB-dependent receptor plug domain-containing protein [Aquimarina hainanensis]|uniref:TonB-dependent receptor plug domain-containing protein n=1 Tax=Aquimarina hainanensis TaxID=1578017 RepID=UPI00360F3410